MKNPSLHPFEILFSYYKSETPVFLLERNTRTRYYGVILGFDEHMNIVFSEGQKRFLIKGDCISGVFKYKA